jgi:hypothetical protein
MTALTVARKTESRVSAFDMFWTLLLSSATYPIFHGAMVEVYQGKIFPAGTNGTDGVIVLGRATSNNGVSTLVADEKTRVDQGIFGWANSAGGDAISANHIGLPCYAVDDQTVALTSAGGTRPVAGEIADFSDSQVWVLQGIGVRPGDAEGVALNFGRAQLAISHTDLTEGDTSQNLAFAAALPANAAVIGVGIDVTEKFDNAGETATTTCDVGYSNGDEWLDAAALGAVAKVGIPVGDSIGGMCSGVTPTVKVDSDVNMDTHTMGEAVVYLAYVILEP